ncbi:hypothetical protein EJ08DRAFT_682944 [Tothia fuscella]|uniref:Uncharacterized protein n=1 Tax=Tothia fuscella TaxID=1048955 RepID=A0A9P4TTM6_9PEZI|nr:hypothetical protein EJ08DRAFT_682944 [Tothia fuscella]
MDKRLDDDMQVIRSIKIPNKVYQWLDNEMQITKSIKNPIAMDQRWDKEMQIMESIKCPNNVDHTGYELQTRVVWITPAREITSIIFVIIYFVPCGDLQQYLRATRLYLNLKLEQAVSASILKTQNAIEGNIKGVSESLNTCIEGSASTTRSAIAEQGAIINAAFAAASTLANQIDGNVNQLQHSSNAIQDDIEGCMDSCIDATAKAHEATDANVAAFFTGADNKLSKIYNGVSDLMWEAEKKSMEEKFQEERVAWQQASEAKVQSMQDALTASQLATDTLEEKLKSKAEDVVRLTQEVDEVKKNFLSPVYVKTLTDKIRELESALAQRDDSASAAWRTVDDNKRLYEKERVRAVERAGNLAEDVSEALAAKIKEIDGLKESVTGFEASLASNLELINDATATSGALQTRKGELDTEVEDLKAQVEKLTAESQQLFNSVNYALFNRGTWDSWTDIGTDNYNVLEPLLGPYPTDDQLNDTDFAEEFFNFAVRSLRDNWIDASKGESAAIRELAQTKKQLDTAVQTIRVYKAKLIELNAASQKLVAELPLLELEACRIINPAFVGHRTS